MDYSQALTKIHSLDKFGSRPGLDRINKLFDILGDDLLSQKFIHIAGTNGKGSTSIMLSHILEKAGYKVGLFISPYITDFRERIQINNNLVSKKELTSAIEYMSPILDELSEQGIIITEFEFLTAVSFYIFKKNNCDIIVCETGLGGLLDSTNLIKAPLCSVLTKIDLDHTAILGDTIEEICMQKCGIIKENRITVSALQSDKCNAIINEQAKLKHNKLYTADAVTLTDVSLGLHSTEFCYDGDTISMSLIGKHQVDNARTAIATLNSLKENNLIDFSKENLKEGFKSANNPARFELLNNDPIVILDGAHNTNGITAFKKATERFIQGKRLLILGMLSDKDVESSVALLDGMFDMVIVTDVNNPRNLDCYKLADICKPHFDRVLIQSNPCSAFDTAYQIAKDNDYSISICGSLYLAGEIRPYILEKLRK